MAAGCQPSGSDDGPVAGSPAAAEAPPDHAATVQAWRDKHEADYLREWVSIAALHFLDPGTHSLGSAGDADIRVANVPASTGDLQVDGGTVRFRLEPGVSATHAGAPVSGEVVMKTPKTPAAEEVVIGDVRLVVHESGNRLSLRVRDPDGEPARAFAGFAWFAIDPAYRVVGRFIPDAEPRDMQVLNTFGDIDTYATQGVVEFMVHGRTLRLRPFTTRPNRFYFVFRDASSGDETYETARFLYADLLADGTTVLDFNEAYNPPCAFNTYTTCPIPLRENVLPVEILAGERAYAGGK
jgi:uncharacterized protein (DUF1684 family)